MTGGTEEPTLYLVDGTSQLFRAFYAVRGLSRPDGFPTNAVYGFTAMLRKLLREERPRFIAVAFDLPGPTFRHDRYADYKANRPAAPEELNVQVPWAKRVCEALKVPVLEREGYEADDLIATFAARAAGAGFRVVIVANDKDLLQLVDDGIEILNPSKDLRLDSRGVETFFGVPPRRVRDVLGLMGDSVDNIPGVPGVGEKTALAMVKTYGGLDEVLDRASRLAEVFEARDASIRALEELGAKAAGASTMPPGLAAALRSFAERGAALAAVEADVDFRVRLSSAVAESRRLADAVDAEAEGNRAVEPRQARGALRALKDLERGSSRKIWGAVHEHADQARLSRELATVDRAVPVPFEPERLLAREPDRDALAAIARELGFRSLLAETTAEKEEPTATPPSQSPGRAGPRYSMVLTRDALRTTCEHCRRAGRFAVDTETDGTDPLRCRLVGISLAWEEGEGVYVPLGHVYLGAPDQLSLQEVRAELGPVLADRSVKKIGQNLKFDLHVLERHGLDVDGWELDTMVAAFLLEPDRPTFNMDSLAKQHLGIDTIRYEDVAGSGRSQLTLDHVDVARVTEYAAEDADVALRLANVLAPRLSESGLDAVWRDLDGPLLPVLARMERWGILVDTTALAVMSAEMDRALDRARREIHALAGGAFNVDSPKQLRDVLFVRLGLSPGRKTAKGGVPSTDAATLELLAEEHEIARKLLDYRELAKLKSTYVDTLPLLVDPSTGRVHTSFHPTGAATGRLSSSDPNLQNIPARTPAGLRIRSAFVPERGFVFLASDYSQVELRVLAHLCGDAELTSAFRSGEDIHRRTASRVFGVEPDQVTAEMRRRAKAVNFGILYGMSETRLARDQGMSRAEARGFIESYFGRFGAVRTYIERTRNEARRSGVVRTLFGRVRRFPELHARPGRAAEEAALRAAVNTTIQGTAADLMKLAMLRADGALRERGSRARMLLQVHDELLFEVPEEEIDAVAALVRETMEGVHPLSVPLVVDQKIGKSWMEVT